MKPFRQFLEESLKGNLNKDELKLLPSGYQRVGDIIIVNLQGLESHEKAICDLILGGVGPKTVCVKSGGISGDKREPSIRKVSGNGTETVHEENGCRYMLDVARVMFAKGNVRERGRIAGLIRPGEDVLDMFAGIGYFSIPIAKACPSCRVISVDINPVSVSYLTKNAALNKLRNIRPILGDCRNLGLEDAADRISMGYLPGTHEFLPAAFRYLKGRGVIHFHDVYRDEELWDRPLKVLEEAAEKAGYRLEKVLHKGIVKQYGPRKQHVVIDALFVRA